MRTRWVLPFVAAIAACSDDMPPSAPQPPTTISVAYCDGRVPSWVALQDGDGAWTRAQPVASGANTTFRYDFSANRGAIATLTRISAEITVLSVLYGTPAELVTVGDTNPEDCAPTASKHLFGTVVGLDTNESAFVGGSLFRRARVLADGTFELRDLPSGPNALLATTQINGADVPNRLILRRDIDVPDSASVPVLDFASEAFAPAIATVSLDGLGADGATYGTRLLTSHDDITVASSGTTVGTGPYAALPEARLRAGDLQILSASSTAAVTGSARSATLYFRAPTDRTLAFGAPLIQPTFTTVATAPALRLRAQFVPQSDYDRSAFVTYQQSTTTLLVFVAISMTGSYAALTGTGYDLVIPDLSGAPGFDPAWSLHAGGTLRWTAARVGGTVPLGRDAVPSDGATQQSVLGVGEIVAAAAGGVR